MNFWQGLGTIEGLFLLAPLVVVPLAMKVERAAEPQGALPLFARVAARIQTPAAWLAAASFLVPAGPVAAALAAPWLGFTLCIGAWGLERAWRLRIGSAPATCLHAALLYLPVGGVFLLLSRGGVRPMGFVEPIVLLTAVHFHFTAFAALVLAGAIGARLLRPGRGASLFAVASAGVIVGPALLAAGWTFFSPTIKVTGALTLSISHALVALLAFSALPRIRSLPARLLLGVSASSLLMGMALAALYAVGEKREVFYISIPQMALFHGAANALGYALCGLAAIVMIQRKASIDPVRPHSDGRRQG